MKFINHIDPRLARRLQSRRDGVVIRGRHFVPDLELIELLYVEGHVDRLDLAVGCPDVHDLPGVINRLYGPRSLGLLGVLLEPTTVVTKAWEQVLAVGQRAFWEPRTVLVTGAGPIGLLAALVGRLRGLDVHVLDRAKSGPKPELVRGLGATYHTGTVKSVGLDPDVIIECTGVGQVINDAIRGIGAGGVVCLTGVGTGGSTVGPAVADVAAAAVLKNNVVVGSVNANKRHWYKASQVLAAADRAWLARLVTRCEPPEEFMRALQRQPEDIKVVIQFAQA